MNGVSLQVYTLFKSFPMEENTVTNNVNRKYYICKYGLFVTDKAMNHVKNLNDKIFEILPHFGSTLKSLNTTFHKSFDIVRDSTEEALVYQQILHYMTTYGAEHYGIFDSASVYIPHEAMGITDNGERVFVNIVDGITVDEIHEKIVKLLASGVALSAKSIECIVDIINFYSMKINIDECNNKEVRVILCRNLDLIPSNPIEFLRYMIYCATNTTMIIKNRELFDCIRMSMCKTTQNKIPSLLNRYIKKNGIEALASIFYRYKPLFLAFKNAHTKKTINAIRRSAVQNHKPMKQKILDVLTSTTNVDMKELKKELENITVFKKASLLNSILYRESTSADGKKPFVYRIRNGKVFAREVEDNYRNNAFVTNAIINSIVADVNEKVKGKKIYYSDVIDFTFPTSEKNFVGGIPNGSTYTFTDTVDKASLVGVHWMNQLDENGKEHRIDLDLHYSSVNSSIGWDSCYRDSDSGTFFSGDMTDAPISDGGAAEYLYIENADEEYGYMFTLNHFNFVSYECNMPYELCLGNVDKLTSRHSTNAVATATGVELIVPLICNGGENMIGFFNKNDDGKKQFTFTNVEIGRNISYRHKESNKIALKYMSESVKTQLRLKTILDMCDVTYVDDPKDADIVIDYKSMGGTTILDMIV